MLFSKDAEGLVPAGAACVIRGVIGPERSLLMNETLLA